MPLSWSVTTCERLTLLGKNVECFYYDNMPHTFYGQGEQELIRNTVDFFNRELK